MSDPRIIEINGATIDCHVDEVLAPSVLRTFAGATPLDFQIDHLVVPERPVWLRTAILGLRWHRARIAGVGHAVCLSLAAHDTPSWLSGNEA